MAGSVNEVTLLGHLGKDPEVRRTQGGSPVVSFSIATSETWRDRSSGERKERTEWHNVVIWQEGLTKIAEDYLRKGSKVLIRGKLQTRKWQDQNGNDRYSTEVVLQGFDAKLIMLDGRDSSDGGGRRDRDDDRRGDGRDRDDDRGRAGDRSRGRADDRYYDDADIPF